MHERGVTKNGKCTIQLPAWKSLLHTHLLISLRISIVQGKALDFHDFFQFHHAAYTKKLSNCVTSLATVAVHCTNANRYERRKTHVTSICRIVAEDVCTLYVYDTCILLLKLIVDLSEYFLSICYSNVEFCSLVYLRHTIESAVCVNVDLSSRLLSTAVF